MFTLSFFFFTIFTKISKILPIISIVFECILLESSSGTPFDFLMNTSNPIVGQDKSTCMGAGAWVERILVGGSGGLLRLAVGYGRSMERNRKIRNLLKSHKKNNHSKLWLYML